MRGGTQVDWGLQLEEREIVLVGKEVVRRVDDLECLFACRRKKQDIFHDNVQLCNIQNKQPFSLSPSS